MYWDEGQAPTEAHRDDSASTDEGVSPQGSLPLDRTVSHPSSPENDLRWLRDLLLAKFSTHTNGPADALVLAQSYSFQTLVSRNISESISVVQRRQVWDHSFTTAPEKSYGHRYHLKQNCFRTIPIYIGDKRNQSLPLLKYNLHVVHKS